jgi:hypothetical protein
VSAQTQPSPTPPVLPSDGKALAANGVQNNALVPPTAGTDDAAPADQSGNNGSTAFGADTLNARIVSGAPIYASQPTAAMATVAPHLLDAANTHPLPGEPVGKPGDDTNGKAPTDANAILPPSTANAATTPAAPSLLNHPATAAAANVNNDNGDNGGTPAQTADNSATATGNDPSASNASLLAQPNQPQTTPVQVDAAVHTAAPYVPVGEQVALNLKQAIAADNNEIRIQLKPASLGTIDVKLNVGQDGRVNAVISADRSDTLNMLKQDAGTLQQALRDAGLNADSSSLSFNLSSDAQSFAQNWSQGSSGGNGNGSNPYAGTASDALADGQLDDRPLDFDQSVDDKCDGRPVAEFQHLPDAADDAAPEPGSALAARHESIHPTTRVVQPSRAADQHEQQSAAAHRAARRE